MARIARVVAAGLPHLLTQRGNRGMKTFFRDADYEAYLSLAAEWCDRHAVAVWAYCLMPTHMHLVLVPPSEDALCRAIGEAHRRYTRMVNARKGWLGHLWQGRFASFVMDEPYLLEAARHVEMNPVRANLVKHPEDWPWSSALAHISGNPDELAESAWLRQRRADLKGSWRKYLMEDAGEDIVAALRRHEGTGRPLGDFPFVKKIGKRLGRDLVPKKPGPKAKKRKTRKRRKK